MSIYAPTDDTPIHIKEGFYRTLSQQLEKISKSKTLILAGDFNGKVGTRKNDSVVGQFGDPAVNDSGGRLIEMCNQYGLTINNTFFQHKQIHQYTWTRPTLNQKSIIDFIITRQKASEVIRDAVVKRGANCGSDHYLVISEFVFPFINRNNTKESEDTIKNRNTTAPYPRYNIHLIKDDSIRYLYERRLNQYLLTEEPKDQIEEEHRRITEAIHKASRDAFGLEEQRKPSPLWMTSELEGKIEEKKLAYKNWIGNQTQPNWNKYKELQREVRRRVKEEKNLMWERKCIEIESKVGGSQSTEVWRSIRAMKTERKETTGNFISTDTWKTHYSKLLIEQRKEFMNTTDDNEELGNRGNLTISTEDVIKAVSSNKNGRAPGPGGIMTEMIKYGGDTLIKQLTRLMNLCLEKNQLPDQWKISYITSVYKKGQRKEPNNYRGLSVNCTLSRLFCKIIKSELEEAIKDKISEEQSGFTSGRSCVDNLFTLQQLIEKRNAHNTETHLAFIDLEKAYDSVPRNKLWQALNELEVHCHLIKIIKEIYRNNVAYVKVGNELSSAIFPSKGLRQGCSLSPLLFNLYLEVALKEWKTSCRRMGIPIGEEYLLTMSFADDQAVIAQDDYDLEFMLRRLYLAYKKWGLNINVEKTKYLVTNSEAQFKIFIHDNLTLQQVDAFRYLGAIVTKEGLGTTGIRYRIEESRRVLGCLNSIWWDKNITPKTKVHIGQALVESVLLYGCEVWTLNAELKKRINALEMDYLRRSARVSRLDRIRNEDIRRRMNAQRTVVERVEERGLRWFGHLLRMDENRLPRRIYEWKPPGRKKRGRPKRSWSEGMRKAMGVRGLEEEDVYDRNRWRLGVRKQL